MALYCFGDSYTEGYKNDMKFHPYNDYRKYLGVNNPQDMPPIWSEILGEKLGIKSFNHAKGGSSNHEIFLKICNNVNSFKKNDIVIINWTLRTRCSWVIELNDYDEESNKLTSINPTQPQHYDDNGIWKSAYELISINRSDFSWTFEVIAYQKIIDELSTSVGFRVYYWFTDDELFRDICKVENTNQSKYIINDLIQTYNDYDDGKEFRYCCIPFDIMKQYGAKTIEEDANGNAADKMHLGGTGHKVQADIFYSYLTNTPYPKKLEKYL